MAHMPCPLYIVVFETIIIHSDGHGWPYRCGSSSIICFDIWYMDLVHAVVDSTGKCVSLHGPSTPPWFRLKPWSLYGPEWNYPRYIRVFRSVASVVTKARKRCKEQLRKNFTCTRAMHGDLWWFMMIYDDLWWCMMMYDDVWCIQWISMADFWKPSMNVI